jgi:hypothetical protein
MVIFEVYTIDRRVSGDRRQRIGWYGVPVMCIRSGYRVVPLMNSKFVMIPDCYLFTRVTVTRVESPI